MWTALLPGTLCDGTLWADVALPAGAVCLPALHGSSLKAAAQQVLGSGAGPFHLVGFSLGAIVAFEVLRLAPEQVASLTLLSANPQAPSEAQLAAWAEQERGVRQGQFERVAQQLSRPAGTQQPRVQQMAQQVGPEIFLDQLHLLRSRPDSRPTLAAYRGRCQLLVGELDQVTPERYTREMAALMPQARVEVIAGAGHYLPLDAPAAVGQALAAFAKEAEHV